MTLQEFQELIIKDEGVCFSDGTLNLRHLLPKAYDLFNEVDIEPDLRSEIKGLFIGEEPTFYNQFYGDSVLNHTKEEEASYLWNEDIYNLFNEIAPEGFYFGSNEGDGAYIGWFKVDENEY